MWRVAPSVGSATVVLDLFVPFGYPIGQMSHDHLAEQIADFLSFRTSRGSQPAARTRPNPTPTPEPAVEGCRRASSRCQIAYAPVSRTVTPDGDSSSSIGSSVTHSLGKSARRTPDESSTSPGPVKVPAEMWTGPSLNHTS